MKLANTDKVIKLMYNHRKAKVRKKNYSRFMKECKRVYRENKNIDKWLGCARSETLAVLVVMERMKESKHYIINKIKEDNSEVL